MTCDCEGEGARHERLLIKAATSLAMLAVVALAAVVVTAPAPSRAGEAASDATHAATARPVTAQR